MQAKAKKRLDIVYRSARRMIAMTFWAIFFYLTIPFVLRGAVAVDPIQRQGMFVIGQLLGIAFYAVIAGLGLLYEIWRLSLLNAIDRGDVTLDPEDYDLRGKQPNVAEKVRYLRGIKLRLIAPIAVVAILVSVRIGYVTVETIGDAIERSRVASAEREKQQSLQDAIDRAARAAEQAARPTPPSSDPAPPRPIPATPPTPTRPIPEASGTQPTPPAPPAAIDPRAPEAAMTFDGRDDYIEIPIELSPDLAAGPFTLEATIRATRGQTTYPQILSNRPRHGEGFSFGLWSDGRLYMQVQGDNLGRSNGPDLRDGRWHRVAAVRSGSTIHYYIDGEPAGQAGCPADLRTTSRHPLWIGWDRGNRNETAFEGELADVRIWRTPRTAEQIKASATELAGGDDDLLARWLLNDSDTQTAVDTAGNRHGRLGRAENPESQDPSPWRR